MSLRPTKSFPARFRVLPLVTALASLTGLGAQAAPIFVTNNASSGPGSLSGAILAANTNCVGDPNPVISFNIPGTGPFTISAASALPTFLCGSGPYNPVVDGSTQPGSSPNPVIGLFFPSIQIFINGAGHILPMCGLTSLADTLTVRGLKIFNYNVYGSDAGICGTGLRVEGSLIEANWNGIRATGATPAIVGGAAPAQVNLIGGNTNGFGIDLQSSGINVVSNNLIGVDNTAVVAYPNSVGVYVNGTAGASIVNNVISGNSSAGVRLNSPAGTITVSGNNIGVGPGNVAAGILVDAAANNISILGNNTITNNTVGVDVGGPTATGVYIHQNNISGNSSKAISLGVVGGPRPNDLTDIDTGPNNGQNYPTILSVSQVASNTIITFSFNSNPSDNFTLEFYSNTAPGVREGQAFIGSIFGVTTDGAGNLSSTNTVTLGGTFNNVSGVAVRQSTNDVSEFSLAVAATATPAASLVPTTLAFGNVGTGGMSATQTSTYTSTGSGSVLLSAVGSPTCYGGPVCNGTTQFICSTTCAGGMYASGSSCTVTAAFAPTVLGPQTTTIQICDLAAGSPRTITLSGTGVAPPAFTLSPTSYDFGNVPVGATAATSFALQNTGAVAIPMGTYSTGGAPYVIQNVTCNNPIQVGEICRIDVGFTPSTTGLVTDALVVTPSAGTPASIGLMGTGTVAPQVNTPSLIEVVYVVGAAPTVYNLELKNTGTAPATIGSLTVAGAGFTLEHNCPATLAVGASCTAKISFSSDAPGNFSGTLTFITNAPGGSRVIGLLAHASLRPVPLLQVTPRETGYGARAFGSTSPTSPVILKNIGGADVRFDSIVVSPNFVIISKSCGTVLPSLASCELQVAMRATSYGQQFGFVTINSNAEASPHHASLFGTSCRIGGFAVPRQGLGTGC